MQPPSRPFEQLPPVLLTHEYAPFRGGVATYVREIALAAGRLNLPVEIWTVDYRGRGRDVGSVSADLLDSEPGVLVVRLASNGRLTPGGLWGLGYGLWRRRKALRGRQVILLSVGAQMVFFVLGLLGGVDPGEATCFFHGSEILRFQRNRVWRWLARRFYAQAGGFAVNSFHVEQLLRASGLLPDGAAVRVAPCALPSSFVESASLPLSAKPAMWNLLTVARLHPRKGQLEVARALSLLPGLQAARVIYRMIGTGNESYRRQVQEACDETAALHEFCGEADDRELEMSYRQATIYVQASLTLPQSVEGFGITFLEASFHGCPVVAYNSGGVSEAVRDGETGLLVPEGDLPALAAAIGRLLDDPALRTRLGAAGKTFARGFSWEESARVLLAAGVR